MATFDFEDGLIPASFTNGDNAPWINTSAQANGGTKSMKSADSLGNRRMSSLFIIGDFAAGDFDCSYLVSSENNFDFGYIVVDGTEIVKVSGAGSWTAMTQQSLSAGVHVIQFSFIKDASSASGDDAFYIDDITLPSFTDLGGDIDKITIGSTVFTNDPAEPWTATVQTGADNTPFTGASCPTSGAADVDKVLEYDSPSDSPAGTMFVGGHTDNATDKFEIYIDDSLVYTDSGVFGGGRASRGFLQAVTSGTHNYKIVGEELSSARAYMFYEPSFTEVVGGAVIPVIMNHLRNQGIS